MVILLRQNSFGKWGWILERELQAIQNGGDHGPGGHAVRVVDYKTGRKDFDYCDVLNGLGLQMLLYLFALEDHGRAYLGVSAEAAGVLYFPARAAVLPVEGPVEPQEARLLRQKEARRKGLLLLDEDVLQAMDGSEESRFLLVTVRLLPPT